MLIILNSFDLSSIILLIVIFSFLVNPGFLYVNCLSLKKLVNNLPSSVVLIFNIVLSIFFLNNITKFPSVCLCL
jgi:hypothetical protein